ncbi:secretin receptor isoform X2 [Octopus bimaculoides]|uniref:secretin receptor isoform X2 n=1 Tax=Octopus bimaculoides TaxID=37653 RepID=UPI00071CB8A6|nr:secretin receptor isoform X2 [Octopus bimaculoides]|eukprot:XP_014779368.1 PREDICTED: secretin receptor-like isoform X2 [Octopus bimaculoides]
MYIMSVVSVYTLAVYTLIACALLPVHTFEFYSKFQVKVSKEEQRKYLYEAHRQCNISSDEVSSSNPEGARCSSIWDGILCWPQTLAGTVAELQCPSYINNFYTNGLVSRKCMENGQWYVLERYNRSWTNYSQCFGETNRWVKVHLSHIPIIYTIGYGISLVSLCGAVLVMLYFRRLHCSRNMLHINMFMSFILRAAVCLIKEQLLVDGFGLPDDLQTHSNGQFYFRDDSSHWQCKVLFSLFHYTLAANYIWILMEGLYLHNLVTVAMFSQKSGVRPYIVVGWCFPFSFVIPWVVVRLFLEDTYCWYTHSNKAYFWIMKGPIMGSVMINFLLFLNIIRVLFSKFDMNRPKKRARNNRYRRLAKSTLVLIPLFGIHYMVFLWLPDDIGKKAELVKLYFEMLFNSFQVQSELRKMWMRKKQGRLDSASLPRSQWQTFFSSSIMRNRSSVRCTNSPSHCHYQMQTATPSPPTRQTARSNLPTVLQPSPPLPASPLLTLRAMQTRSHPQMQTLVQLHPSSTSMQKHQDLPKKWPGKSDVVVLTKGLNSSNFGIVTTITPTNTIITSTNSIIRNTNIADTNIDPDTITANRSKTDKNGSVTESPV